jgi:uncharacterized protein (TIGR03066 family)
MPLARRPFVLVAAALLFAAGCGSNKDKLVGKWKIVEANGKAAKADEAGFAYMNFDKDGTFKFGFEVTSPTAKKEEKEFAEAFSFGGKYTVEGDKLDLQPSGDKNEMQMKKKGKLTMKFDGDDKLTVTDPDGDTKLTRIK